MLIPAALSEEDLGGTPSLQALKKTKQQLTQETVTPAVLAQVCRLQATSGSTLLPDAKVIAINRLYHHCLHVEDVGDAVDDDDEDGATEAPDVQAGYSVAMFNDVASLKAKVHSMEATVNEMKKTLDDFEKSTEQSFKEIRATLTSINTTTEIDAQRRANGLRSSTDNPWDIVTRRLPKADRPLITVTSTSQLLALSVDEIVEHLEQHTGLNYAGLAVQDLRMQLALDLGVNVTVFQAEVQKLALKRKFVEDEGEAAGMDQ